MKVTFTPHLLPTRRGILATVYGRLRPGKTGADAAAAIKELRRRTARSWAGDDARRRCLGAVVGTNRVLMAADADPERGVAIAVGGARQPGEGGRRPGGAEPPT